MYAIVNWLISQAKVLRQALNQASVPNAMLLLPAHEHVCELGAYTTGGQVTRYAFERLLGYTLL